MENQTAGPPNLFLSTGASPLPVTTFEKEVFLTTTSGKPINYTIRAYPNQKLDIQLEHAPLNGSIDFTAHRSFSYSSDSFFQGMDTFSFLLSNGVGHKTVIPFTVLVNSPRLNEENVESGKEKLEEVKPTHNTSQYRTSPGQKLVKDIPLQEYIEEPYTVSLKKPSAHGRVNVYADGTFEYTSPTNFCGTDSFQISQHFAEGDREDITIEVLVVKPVTKKLKRDTGKSKGTASRKRA